MEQFIAFAQQNFLLAAAWVILLILFLYTFIAPMLAQYKRVNNHEATLLINKQDAVILDVRAQKEYRNGHIQNAKLLKPEQAREGDFSKLENLKNTPIIVVCAMGNLASGTATKLTKQGFEQVYVLEGGMSAWTSAGLPTSK